ncbi:unnamed protein product [Orchesella dallaii]|uniref:Uncharacterized protein n=1 Tax=Orchesella dallaii TaxID=48710 RepID=A0ABP1S146_9HEXA
MDTIYFQWDTRGNINNTTKEHRYMKTYTTRENQDFRRLVKAANRATKGTMSFVLCMCCCVIMSGTKIENKRKIYIHAIRIQYLYLPALLNSDNPSFPFSPYCARHFMRIKYMLSQSQPKPTERSNFCGSVVGISKK